MTSRRTFLHELAMLAAAAAVPIQAGANAPGRIGRLLVGATAGSQMDLVARLIASRLKEPASQNFIVENRPGATGRIAIAQLKGSEPDGSTLLLIPSGWMTTIPHMRKNNPYDPLTDFTPICKACSFDFALTLGPAAPVRTLPEFVQWCKANPKLANVSVPLAGGTLELLAWMFARSTGLDLPVVPYKGGGGDFRSDLLAGRVPCGIGLLSDFLPDHQAGKLRIITTTGSQRSPLLPEVPTFAEQGHPELAVREWFGIVGPARMPIAVRQKIAEAIQSTLKTPDDLGPLAKLGLEPTVVSGAAFEEDIRLEYGRWRDVVKTVGFKPID